MAKIFTVEQRGIGKPDYTKEVSSGQQRAGLTLAYRQTLKIFGVVFSDIVSPYAWVQTSLPPGAGGTHTGGVSLTVMTDATAAFVVNSLVGLTIKNITDGYGSSGVIIANTVNTVSVAALTGGFLNQWTFGDAYIITAHYIDNVTGIALPFTIPQGYTLTLIAAGGGFTEDAIGWAYIDGFLVLSGGIMASGQADYQNPIVGISTSTIDPTGLTSHALDIQVTNLGAGNLQGGISWTGILEAVSTPPLPTTKTVRCKWCGHEQTVPRETTRVICPKCEKLTIYYDLSRIRRTS